jgi:hypothetical protein
MPLGAIEQFIERAVPAQYAVDEVGGYTPDRKAGHLFGACRASLRPVGRFHAKNYSLRREHGYAKSKPMPTDPNSEDALPSQFPANQPAASRRLSPAAERALAEAAARRAERNGHSAVEPEENGGRGGLDPTRYGDWEVNGITSDF